MAAPKKKSSPILWVGIAGLAVAVLIATSSDDEPAKVAKKPRSNVASTGSTDTFTPEDYSAKFAAYTTPAKNVFKPLVARAENGLPNPGGIPGSLTEGDGMWTYTGLVEVNGQLQALFENSTNGDSVYLKVGEHWKKTTVKSIDSDRVILVGVGGEDINVKMSEPAAIGASGSAAGAAGLGVAPVKVQPGALRGTIGQSLDVTPVAPAADAQPTRRGRRSSRSARQGAGNGEQNDL